MNRTLKFLDSYTIDDIDIFFGRDRECTEIYNRLFADKVTVVYGKSGTGKTSIINCGVANLCSNIRWFPIFVRRMNDINVSLRENCLKMVDEEIREKYLESDENGVPVFNVAKIVERINFEKFKPVYIIIDQFEELFILGSKEERKSFIETLKELNEVECRLIFIIREEYLADMTEIEEEIPDILENRIRIEKVSERLAKNIIENICGRSEFSIDEDIVQNILENFNDDKRDGGKASNVKKEIELSYLQVYLDKVFSIAVEKGSLEISKKIIADAGNISRVLENFIKEEIIDKSSDDGYSKEKILLLLKKMVSEEGTKRTVDIEKLAGEMSDTEEYIKNVLSYLEKKRILRNIKGSSLYELGHDSLAHVIQEWKSPFERGLEEFKGKITDLRKRSRRLDEAECMEALKYLDYLAKEEKGYVDGCIMEIERARKEKECSLKKKRMLMTTGVTLAIVVLIVFSVSILVAYRMAEAEKGKAVIDKINAFKAEQIALKALEEKNKKINDVQEILSDYFYADLYNQGKQEQIAADKEGWKLIRLGKFREAEAILLENIKDYNDAWYSNINIGHIRMIEGKYKDAEEYYRKGLKYLDNKSFKKVVNDFDVFIMDGKNKKGCLEYQAWFLEEYPKEREKERKNSFVLVESGTFIMGDTFGDGESDEKPKHQVTLDSFYIGKCEVTQKEWKEIMWNNPSSFKGDNLPVEEVSWYDVVEYCNRRSEIEGLEKVYSYKKGVYILSDVKMNMKANGYRLPTEAEWEYAARKNGKNVRFVNGDNLVSRAFPNMMTRQEKGYADVGKYPRGRNKQVGLTEPNALGIYDMGGNVLEWCWDLYGEYSSESQTNPLGVSNSEYRIMRGGFWQMGTIVRIAEREKEIPQFKSSFCGFRVVRSFL